MANEVRNNILVGLGGTGGKILKAIRKRLNQEYSQEEQNSIPISFLYVDSTETDRISRETGKDMFENTEFLYIQGKDIKDVLRSPSSFPKLAGVIENPEGLMKAIGDVSAAAGQKRRAGRILFAMNIDNYITAITNCRKEAHGKNKTGCAKNRIFIFAGLSGGTGSGSIIDVIAQTRNIPEFKDRKETEIIVFAMVPELAPPAGADVAGRYFANAYAALKEINDLQLGNYKPFNVAGGMYDHLDLGELPANGVYLFSDRNEYGKQIPHPKGGKDSDLYSIVGDFAYARMFMGEIDDEKQQLDENYKSSSAGMLDEFRRSYSFENIESFRMELDTKDRPFHSKAFSSLGVKRMVIPDNEILEYFVYSFGRQALLQMLYNNWVKDKGFASEPNNKPFHDDNTAEKSISWKITKEYLTLDLSIFPERNFARINDYWEHSYPEWLKESLNRNGTGYEDPVGKLEQLFVGAFEGSENATSKFRNKGVRQWYDNAISDIDDYAEKIANNIKTDLFNDWCNGSLSVYDVDKRLQSIIDEVVNRKKELNNDYTSALSQCNIDQAERDASLSDYLEKKKSLFFAMKRTGLTERHARQCYNLYKDKTRVVALDFGCKLVDKVLSELRGLLNEVQDFQKEMVESISDAATLVGNRCNDDTTHFDLDGYVIRFYDSNKVKEFVEKVVRDKKLMDQVFEALRTGIVNFLENKADAFVGVKNTLRMKSLPNLLFDILSNVTEAIHDDLCIKEKDKLLHRNILTQMAELYKGEQISQLAEDMIKKGGTYMEINDTELDKVKGLKDPNSAKGKTIAIKTVFVQLPRVEGNNSEVAQDFSKKLAAELEKKVSSGIKVVVDTNGTKSNEISVMSVIYCFPVRVLKHLPSYAEKYNYLTIKDPNAEFNRLMLHCEGKGDQFTPLELPEDKSIQELRDMYIPYLMLAYGTGIIKYGDPNDLTGRKYYCTIKTFGEERLEKIGEGYTSFKDFVYSNILKDETLMESIQMQVQKALQTKYLNINLRETEVKPAIVNIVIDKLAKEFDGNTGVPEYEYLERQAEKAIEMLDL